MNHKLRSYFIAGLIVWLPIVATFLVLRFILVMMDSTLSLLPHAYQPQQLFGFSIPGLGAVLALLVLLTTGVLVTNYVGGRLIELGEQVLARIPIVNTIYHSAKQVMQTLFKGGTESFSQVLLVEYPKEGIWTVGFLTAAAPGQIKQLFDEDVVCVYIPTTPNPTSGFLVMVPRAKTKLLNMSVDEAVKLVISLGVVQ